MNGYNNLDDLQEDMVFLSKAKIQFAFSDWSNRNNVECKMVYANKSHYIV